MRTVVIWSVVLLASDRDCLQQGLRPPKTCFGLKACRVQFTVDLGHGVKLEMVLIQAGEFMMGRPIWKNAANNEKPQHRVRITKPFYLGKYLLTQEQWKAVMGNNPSEFKGPKNPVENVSWDDCQAFLDILNEKFGAGRGKFQLPNEAQWECRRGSGRRQNVAWPSERLPRNA